MAETQASKEQTKKRIAVFFDAPGFDDYPFTDKDFKRAYVEFAASICDRGCECWIVRSQDSYQGGNAFSRGWKFDRGHFNEHQDPFTADVIFNKGHLDADAGANVVNRPDLEDFCTDKWKTYSAFPSLFPKTLLARTTDEYAGALKQFRSMVTVKPVGGWRGQDVVIASVADIAERDVRLPCLVQEFLDTSGGIPGITEGLHDLRMIVVNGDLVFAYVRVPPPNSYVSNYAQGGSWFEVPVKELPHGAIAVFKAVEAHLARRFPLRIYSVDVGLQGKTDWKIFELNSKPALDPRESYPGAAAFMDAVIDALINTCP